MAITKNLVNIGNADISGELTAATLKDSGIGFKTRSDK